MLYLSDMDYSQTASMELMSEHSRISKHMRLCQVMVLKCLREIIYSLIIDDKFNICIHLDSANFESCIWFCIRVYSGMVIEKVFEYFECPSNIGSASIKKKPYMQ